MSEAVATMTIDELRELVEASVEKKILELLGDPDDGLPVRKSLRERLVQQKQAVAAGERGYPFEEVVQQLWLS